MDKTRPTKKQKELLNFIDGFIKGYGYGPSYREIMRALDYKSVSTVATHINGLIIRGWLVKKDNSPRSLMVMMPSTGVVNSTTPGPNVQKAIKAKIDELKQDGDKNADAIETLQKSLDILGFSSAEQTELA